MNCIFCKIITNEIPAHKVYEDDVCFAFLDIHPVSPGHTLLVPKQHFEWMQDVSDDILTHCFLKAKMLMVHLKQKLGADYVQVSVVGKDVPHFHIHLMPRMLDEHVAVNKKDLQEVLEIVRM